MMKLNLKKGDKIYDQLLFPDKAGEVIDIEQYLIVVNFDGIEYYFPYKDDGDDTNNHFPPQLSKTPYQIIGLNAICS